MKPVFPTAYMPPVIYFAALLKFETPEIEWHETFPKQTWRNRCSILSSQGVLNLTVPIVKPQGNHTKTVDVVVDFSQKWQHLHWRAIEAAYNKSPYFLFCRDELNRLIYSKENSLVTFNHALMTFFLKFFKIQKTILHTVDYQKIEDRPDLRLRLTPKTDPLISPDLFPNYYQVFSDRFPFAPNLSVLDLAVNEGPSGVLYLKKLAEILPF